MDLRKVDPKLWTYLILVSIGLILTCSYLIVMEVYNSKKECNNIGGTFDYKFLTGTLCDGKEWVKFNSCQVVKGKNDCNLVWIFGDLIDEFGKIKLNASDVLK